MPQRPMIGLLLLASSLSSQVLVVDRGLTPDASRTQPVERVKGFYGDAFRVGAAGETWMIDSIRMWAVASGSPACPKELGDQIAKLTLLGALDNPPVPGQPACDCHALAAIATAPLAGGSSRSLNPAVKLTLEKGVWRLDFQEVRWSVPGDADVLFTVRASARTETACRAAAGWELAVGPAAPGYRLHILDQAGVPEGLAEAQQPARSVHVQVWAHRTNP